MKTILFFILVICMGAFAQAQKQELEMKVSTISMPIAEPMDQTNLGEKLPAITGIFVLKHSRVKRALSFVVEEKIEKLA
ncbi:hypothetical protein NYZ99_05890 [Maribacter litopenaei]|uniref:CarboxypepD_reg-like domain-containing protein n=1 Tax=Maribacter litopenaei TaxID=2976127 RepID=A0ABY5YB25_9FLAO|nr:hypothetical protein [Maribacter litopenaei]UWX55914.1 hypothetical protein NYZ99_05890 [Maribacter litopenaei]